MSRIGVRGTRALVPIARREVRRHPRRSALIVALIAVPVAVIACGLATQATLEPTNAELRTQELGRADLVVGDPHPRPRRDSEDHDPTDPVAVETAIRDALPAGSEVVPHRRTRLDVSAGDRAASAVVVATEALSRVTEGTLRLERGRLPAAAGEAALSPGLARQLDLAIGDTVALHPGETRLEVVGFARATGARRDWVAVVPVRTVPSTAWLVDLPAGTDAAAIIAELRDAPALAGIEVRTAAAVVRDSGIEPPRGLDPTWFMIGTLALAWTGVVAAATFAIGARSRLREVGLVAANGGTQRQVSRLLLADGLVLGLLGSVLGLIAGLLLAAPVVDLVAQRADRDPGSLRIPVAAEVGAVALGTAAALLAARRPAVRAGRLPTLAALQSRITRPPRRVRAAIAGTVTMGAGAVILAAGASADAEDRILLGTMLIVAGVAMLHRLLVDLVARLASRAPLALRFAARDASRQASRTGPAVVASMLALTAAIGAATIVSTAGARDAANPQMRGLYPPHRLEVGLLPSDDGGGSAQGSLNPDDHWPALERALMESLDARDLGAIWNATAPDPSTSAGAQDTPDGPPAVQVASHEALAVLGVTDTDTLDAYAQGAALRVDHEIVPSPVTLTAADGAQHQLPVIDPRTGTVGALGTMAVAPDVADRLGLTEATSLSVIADLGRPVRDRDLARAHAAALRAVGPGYRIWTSTSANCCDTSRVTLLVLLIGLAIAIPVLALVAALTRSEAHTELAILDAVGIAPRRRRRFAAAGMGLLATLAAILAVPAGLIPAVLYMRADNAPVPGGSIISIPAGVITAAAVGVPLTLAAIGWLTAGRPRPLAAIRP